MDRNVKSKQTERVCVVATREGGVDRNFHLAPIKCVVWVATREGGVDRNSSINAVSFARFGSPPARVAWIETQ